MNRINELNQWNRINGIESMNWINGTETMNRIDGIEPMNRINGIESMESDQWNRTNEFESMESNPWDRAHEIKSMESGQWSRVGGMESKDSHTKTIHEPGPYEKQYINAKKWKSHLFFQRKILESFKTIQRKWFWWKTPTFFDLSPATSGRASALTTARFVCLSVYSSLNRNENP